MSNLLSRFQKFLEYGNIGRRVSAIWHYVLHVVVVYFIARSGIPRLSLVIYVKVLPFLLGHDLAGNPFQFFFSHLLALSLLPGFVMGFVNAKLLRNKVVCFSWLVPVALLVLRFVFTGPGMYPTMLWQSDFRQAFHYFFGGGINIVGEFQNYRDLPKFITVQNGWDFMRGWAQFRATVPAYVGITYSIGAWLSLRMKRTPNQEQELQGGVAESKSAS